MRLLSLAFLLPNFLFAQQKPAEPVRLVISGGTLVDIETGRQIRDSLILIGGSRIQQVARAGEAAIPAGTQVIDARGKWVIPGLMDMHAHVTGIEKLP